MKHFFIIGGGTFVSMLIGFFTTPIITRIVEPTAYGQFSIFTMYSTLILTIVYLGLDQAMVRFFYEDNSDNYHSYLLFKCIKIPLAGIIALSACLIAFEWLNIVHFELGRPLLVLTCVNALVLLVYRFSLLLVRLQYKSKVYSALGIVQKAVYVLIAIALIYYGEMDDAVSLAVATIIAGSIVLVISIISEKNIWKKKIYKEKINSISQKELLKYSYPYVFSMGITAIFQYADQLALSTYCTYREVGIYSSTMTLIHVFAIVQTTFNTMWAPMSIEHYTKDKNDVSFYQKGNQIITLIMFFIGFTLILVKDIFALLLGTKYREAAYILPFLIFNPIMYTISETTVCGLVFKKKSNMQVVVSIGACLVNILGNMVLVPKLGCQGAAISTGISYIVFWTLRTVLSNKYFYVDFHLKKFAFITILAVCYAAYNTFVQFNIFSVLGYIVCVLVLCLLYKDTVAYCMLYIKRSVFRFMSK